MAALEAQVIASRDQAQELAIARGLAGIRRELPDGYRRVPGQVIGKSVDNYYRRIRIDVGTAEGVVKNSPVVAARSPTQPVLVGIVVAAGPTTADVSLVTDQGTEIGATVQGGAQVGVLRAVDNGQLLLDRVPREYRVGLGSVVVTAGFSDSRLASLYPRGIAVGQVTSVGRQETDVNQSVQVSPLVDVRTLSDVLALAPVSALARRRATG
ncbi:MAG: hypothetical protein HYX33_00460 [Actinobacteria bacterium]|nr:hypothetical protein [Actinomycetota bacterium]